MTQPRTAAGRALLEEQCPSEGLRMQHRKAARERWAKTILAIEAEARAGLRAALERLVAIRDDEFSEWDAWRVALAEARAALAALGAGEGQ